MMRMVGEGGSIKRGVSIGWGVRCDASTRQTNRRSSSIFIALSTRKKREKKQKSKELENIEKRGTIRRRRRLRRKKQEKQPSGEQEVGPSRKGLKERFPRV